MINYSPGFADTLCCNLMRRDANSCLTMWCSAWLDCQWVEIGRTVRWAGGPGIRLAVTSAAVTAGALDPQICIWYAPAALTECVCVRVWVQQRIQVNLIQKQDLSLCMSTRPAVCLPEHQRSAPKSGQEQWEAGLNVCVCRYLLNTVILPCIELDIGVWILLTFFLLQWSCR